MPLLSSVAAIIMRVAGADSAFGRGEAGKLSLRRVQLVLGSRRIERVTGDCLGDVVAVEVYGHVAVLGHAVDARRAVGGRRG
jgi:hypothetical protein